MKKSIIYISSLLLASCAHASLPSTQDSDTPGQGTQQTGHWTAADDAKLRQLLARRDARNLAAIARQFQGRTYKQVYYHWNKFPNLSRSPQQQPAPLPMLWPDAALDLSDGPPPLMLWPDATFDLPLRPEFEAALDLSDGLPPLPMPGADEPFHGVQSEFVAPFDFLDAPPQQQPAPQSRTRALKQGVRESKTWTKEEDELITKYVQQHGPTNWAELAKRLPGRPGKQCRERWFNRLNPAVSRADWTPAEDALIIQLYDQYGSHWRKIAQSLSTDRTDNQVKNRWHNRLKKRTDPTVPKPRGRPRKQPAPPPSQPEATGNPTGEERTPQQGQSPGGRDPANPFGFDCRRTFVQ